MPLEDATFINTLKPDWPTGRDPRSQGDDHFRLIKKVLQNTLPNAGGAITGTPEQINNITLNTPWSDNSATPGAPSYFTINNPKAPADEPAPALVATATATLDNVKANPALLVTYQAIANLLYPVGAKYESFTDNRNPVDILGFGVWEAVTGIIAGVGSATDNNGYTQNFSAGYQAGWWRVSDSQIVAQNLNLAMNPVDDHVHTETRAAPASPASVYLRTDALSAGYTTANTGPAGGHTPTGMVTIGAGGAADGTPFYNPYYGCYIWRRTA